MVRVRSTDIDVPPDRVSLHDFSVGTTHYLRGLRAGPGIRLEVADTDGDPLTSRKRITVSVDLSAVAVLSPVTAVVTDPAEMGSATYLASNEETEPSPLVWSGLPNPFVVDGVAPADGARILLAGSPDARGNGPMVYDAAAGGLRRDPLFSKGNAFAPGLFGFVISGSLWGGSLWYLTNQQPVVLGTSGLFFSPMEQSISDRVAAGDMLLLSFELPNRFNFDLDIAKAPTTSTADTTDLVAAWLPNAVPLPMAKSITKLDLLTSSGGIPMATTVGLAFGTARVDQQTSGTLRFFSPSGNITVFAGGIEFRPAGGMAMQITFGSNAYFYGATSIVIPNGDATGRPASPTRGDFRANWEHSGLEVHDGTAWKRVAPYSRFRTSERTWDGTNPIPGFFQFPPGSKNTTHVFVENSALRNDQFEIRNGTDLEIIGYPVLNGQTVWARYF